jgi:hypothetical protein
VEVGRRVAGALDRVPRLGRHAVVERRIDAAGEGSDAVKTCTICHFETVPDDVMLAGPGGRCVCLACFARETGHERRMPPKLRRQLDALLDAIVAAGEKPAEA